MCHSILFRYRLKFTIFLSGECKSFTSDIWDPVLERHPWESFCDFLKPLVKVFCQCFFCLSLLLSSSHCQPLGYRDHISAIVILSQDWSHRFNKCLLNQWVNKLKIKAAINWRIRINFCLKTNLMWIFKDRHN